jgi:hypothetical protein
MELSWAFIKDNINTIATLLTILGGVLATGMVLISAIIASRTAHTIGRMARETAIEVGRLAIAETKETGNQARETAALIAADKQTSFDYHHDWALQNQNLKHLQDNVIYYYGLEEKYIAHISALSGKSASGIKREFRKLVERPADGVLSESMAKGLLHRGLLRKIEIAKTTDEVQLQVVTP